MNITDVRVRKVAKEGKMKAVVSITIDDEFVVHDIKVIEGEKGLFIAMPTVRQQTENIVILHIRSILQHVTGSRRSFWTSSRKLWMRNRKKLQKRNNR